MNLINPVRLETYLDMNVKFVTVRELEEGSEIIESDTMNKKKPVD